MGEYDEVRSLVPFRRGPLLVVDLEDFGYSFFFFGSN